MSDIKWNDYTFNQQVKQLSDEAMKKMCGFLIGDIKRSMLPGAHRPWPSKKGDGSIHWSAAPGSPPAPDTEELKDSISYATSNGATSGVGANSRVGNVGTPAPEINIVQGVVGTQDIKGLWMEMGVKESNVAPRPWLRTAVGRNREKLMNIYVNTLKRIK